METRIAVTARGRARRERLLNVTAELAAARGFHSVGIAEIGAAAGVTGSAIYRHFRNKDEILVALFERVIDGLLEAADRAEREAATPDAALDRLVREHVEFALRDRAILAIYGQEAHNLPGEDRHRLRRKQRFYVQRWAEVLQKTSPELELAEARARVQAVFGLLNSPADFTTRLATRELSEIFAAMATAALLADL
jgi:AcrR family transcriptional regulator